MQNHQPPNPPPFFFFLSDRVRAALATNRAWSVDYLPASRACVSYQTSMLVGVSPTAARVARGLAEAAPPGGLPGVYEFSILAPDGASRQWPPLRVEAALLSEAGGVPALDGVVLTGHRPSSRIKVWRFDSVARAVDARLAADGGGGSTSSSASCSSRWRTGRRGSEGEGEGRGRGVVEGWWSADHSVTRRDFLSVYVLISL